MMKVDSHIFTTKTNRFDKYIVERIVSSNINRDPAHYDRSSQYEGSAECYMTLGTTDGFKMLSPVSNNLLRVRVLRLNMTSLWHQVMVVVTVLVTTVSRTDQDIARPRDQMGVEVGVLVGQVLQKHQVGCHTLLMTTTQHSPVLSSIPRSMSVGSEGITVVKAGSLLSLDQLAQDHLLQGLWGDTRTTCHTLILDLTINNNNNNNNNNATHLLFRILETSRLWQRPETVVVVVGGRTGVKDVLLHHSLRNTVHALYLAVHHLTRHNPPARGDSRLRKPTQQQGVMSDGVRVYRRCLYCNSGRPDVHFLYLWNLTSLAHQTQDLFHEQLHFMGHKFRVVTVPFAPYMDFVRNTDEPGTIVTPTDSLDTRLIHTFSNSLNFTFEIREEPNHSWGREQDGVFSGMIGQLQREEADFSTVTGPSSERLRAIQYLRGYPSDTFNIVSRKPSLLPKHLSLMRPFAGKLWLVLLVIVVAWAVILWLLQKVWWWVAGGRGVGFNITLQYTWGALLEQPPSDPSINTSGRMLVGWWLVFCLVIDTAYRSSLVAHMTVQGKTTPPETFEDLVKLDGWTWGTEPWVLRGYPYEYFSTHTDPVMQQIYRQMEVLVAKEALKKVLEGGFSLFDFKTYIKTFIATRYSDAYGNTPFYISKTGISIVAAFGWSFRKGAPFYRKFRTTMSQMEAAGITQYWIDDVIAKRVTTYREATAPDQDTGLGFAPEEDSSQVSLGLEHLQGAFYVLLFGSSIALVTLVWESLSHCLTSDP
ncbi:glutamate receptor-like [Panulirus ornatus]|uniref:glutamate receptor-like n=1 Tax=Panulirus ornatus TaxID=150431 RepID=UPI003A88E8D1